MKSSILFMVSSALAGVVYAAPNGAQLSAPYCPSRPATPAQVEQIFYQAVQKLYVDRNGTQYALDHLAEDYIQRNPYVLSGRDNAVAGLAFVSPETVNFTILNTAFKENIGFVHFKMDVKGQEKPTAVVDVLRFEGTCIQEHWDVMQQRPDDAVNPLEMW